MGVDAKQKIEKWNPIICFIYMFLGFLMPPVGLALGLYGLNKVGKRLDGLFILGSAAAGVVYMPRLLLLAFFTGGALM